MPARPAGIGRVAQLRIDFDTTDVPRGRFVTAGHAWRQVAGGNGRPVPVRPVRDRRGRRLVDRRERDAGPGGTVWGDDRLRVPDKVFNVRRRRLETL